MQHDAISVTPLADFQLFVTLANGNSGVFDVKPYIDKGSLRQLSDENYFKLVGIEFGAVSWPNGQDIAPNTLAKGLFKTK